MKSSLFQPFQHLVAGLWRTELPGKTLGIEERRQARDNGAFARGILVSFQLGIGGCEHWTRHHLDVAAGVAGEGTVTSLDGFAVAAEEIIRTAQVLSCVCIGAVEAERHFEPGYGLGGSAGPHQNDSPLVIVLCVV